MRTIISLLLTLFIGNAYSQSLNFVFQPTTLNFTSAAQSMTTNALITSNQAGASSYSWSVSGPLSSTCATASQDDNYSLITVHCCGFQYTVTCKAYNLSTLLNTVSKTFQTTCPFGTGINEGSLVQLQVFPNPAGEHVFVSSNAEGELTLYTCEGRLVRTLHSNGSATRLETADLPRGLYLLRFRGAEGQAGQVRVLLGE